ncbi:MAG: chromosomal replication initiator protein DnaA [Phycisphaerales bacterium]
MSDPDRKVWNALLSYLRHNHVLVWRQWFDELEPLGIQSGTMTIRARSEVHRDYLRRDCLDAFNDALRSVTNQLLAVRFLGPRDPGPEQTPNGSSHTLSRPAHTTSEAELAARPDTLIINPDYGFENFVEGPNNRLALAAAKAVADNPGQAYNPLFIHGDVGLGKTHLLQAICLKIREVRPEAVIHYVSCDGFISDFINSVQSGQMSAFRHRFRDVDVLVIDDIHFLAKRDRTQEEFFHTFNTLYQARKQIVLSCDAPPEEVPDLEDRLISRFNWGLVAKIDAPCYETRVAIVKKKAALRHVELPDEVVCHIAAQIDTNIRELEGAIVKIQILASVEGRPIDLELAQMALGDSPQRVNKRPTIDAIINVVTEFFSVKRTDLLGKRRHKSISLPRQICMYLARRETPHSLEEIGAHFGGRDHTTVMHAVRTIESKAQQDAQFASVIQSLLRAVHDE